MPEMTVADAERLECNRAQPVNMYLANYYPTDVEGQTADVIGSIFETKEAAEAWGRAKLETEGVGVVFISFTSGFVLYPLFRPEPS